MPGQALKVEVDDRGEKYVEDVSPVFGYSVLAIGYVNDISSGPDNPLRKQKASRQLRVIPRRAHGDGNTAPLHADFQGLLSCQVISLLPRASVRVPMHKVDFDRLTLASRTGLC